jgi:hypothetical protein
MTAVLTKIMHKRIKSLQPSKIKEYTEQNLEELISTINEKEIESLYNNQELLYLKQRLLVHRIRQLRNASALKIQGMWNRYLTRLKVHKLAHRVRGCYTISPSVKNVTKIYIKIFTDELNKDEFKIMPLHFCQIRKSFVIDIPKNKFYTKKKLLRFYFIYKDKTFFDPKYEQVLFFNEFVHQVDLSIYDKKQKFLDETIYNINLYKKMKIFQSSSKDMNYLSTEDEKESSENSTLTPDKFGKKEHKFAFSENKIEENDEEDEYDGLRAIKRKGTGQDNVKVCRSMKRFESFDMTYSCKSKLKSILKEPNLEFNKKRSNRLSSKKVSFGETVYLY